ncbi:MAG TPA: hypothetical protein VMS55_01140 [Myxococcota bacterium]|nr:hypothetical protein [Myxococcota bacterium]
MKRGSGWRGALALAVACAFVVSAAPAAAQKPESIAKEGGLGVGAAIASMVWAPLKLTHALVGLVAGGLCFAITGGDTEVWNRVQSKALTGDYVITPQHIAGKQRFRFSGGGGDGGGNNNKK